MPQTTDQLTETVRKALHRAYNLGQTYWQQADSESYAANKRSEETAAKFDQLSAETLAALSAVPLVAEAPREPVAGLTISETPAGPAFEVSLGQGIFSLNLPPGVYPLYVAPPVSVAPMPEEWLKEAERLVDETTEAAAVAEAAYRQSDEYPDYGKQVRELDAAKAALLSHIRTAPRPTLSDEPECACMCCKELAAMMANHATDFDYKRACQCAMYAEHEQCDCHFCKSVLASVAPQPEQPNTDSVHLAANRESAVQGLDADAGVQEGRPRG